MTSHPVSVVNDFESCCDAHAERFTGPKWIFERKLDGIGLLASNGRDVRLLTHNQLLRVHFVVSATRPVFVPTKMRPLAAIGVCHFTVVPTSTEVIAMPFSPFNP